MSGGPVVDRWRTVHPKDEALRLASRIHTRLGGATFGARRVLGTSDG